MTHNLTCIKHNLLLTDLVKSVLSAPVPAYCTEHASALSAQTETDITKRKRSKYCVNLFQGFIKSQAMGKLRSTKDDVCPTGLTIMGKSL